MGPRFITHGTAEAKNTDALVNKDLVFDAGASFRREFFVFPVMIPMYVQYWYGRKRYQKGKIKRIQVAAGDDQVDALQVAFFEKVP